MRFGDDWTSQSSSENMTGFLGINSLPRMVDYKPLLKQLGIFWRVDDQSSTSGWANQSVEGFFTPKHGAGLLPRRLTAGT